MLKVGLTGGIGSGKTTVSDSFAEHGADIIDTDILARELVQPQTNAYQKILDYFGTEFQTETGELDRRKLRQRIFEDTTAKAWLENLLHPLIWQQVETRVANSTAAYVLIVVPLLIENNRVQDVDRVLVVDLPEADQIARVTARDQCPEQLVQHIMDSQVSRQERLDKADDIIRNDNSLLELKEEVKKLHLMYLRMSQEHDKSRNDNF